MGMFIRRFLSDPGEEILLEIESVNILDLDPPSSITGVGSGTACIFGEFENGPYNVPTEVTSANDLKITFGAFGYTYGSSVGQNPCARSRSADGAIVAEYWNGNGMVQLNAKKFSRLIIVRVDTSVGAVQFTRESFLTGAALFNYPLANGQLVTIDDGSGPLTATFTGAAATHQLANNFAGSLASGDTVTLGYDAAPDFLVTFLVTDTTAALARDRINQYAGFAFASLNGSKLVFTGLVKGTAGRVRITAESTGVLAKLGGTDSLPATFSGTGNVGNVAAVTAVEVDAVVHAAVASAHVAVDGNGALRLYTTTSTVTVTVQTATALGFPVNVAGTAAAGVAGTIPAGTRVSDGTHHFVTTQDAAVTATNAGPYLVRVRPALDDGSMVSVNAGTITTVDNPIDLGAFSVINLLPTVAALSESAIDVAYAAAINTTIDVSGVSHDINLSWSARQSNAVRRALRQNAIDASAEGCLGRVAVLRPPMGTTEAQARSTTAEPGVGTYRSDRVIYTWPNAASQVPPIATVGLAGGAGFTANGIVDVGADGFMVSICSQLAPEENPGQETTFANGAVALESSSHAQGLGVTDFILLKAAGIAGMRITNGSVTFQSGVTSVDPLVQSNRKNIARRRMADFIQDSVSIAMTAFGKQLNRKARRTAIVTEISVFLKSLQSPNNPSSQRIDSYALDSKTGNTPDSLAKGRFRVKGKVRTLSSLDSIEFETEIGESVTVTETAA